MKLTYQTTVIEDLTILFVDGMEAGELMDHKSHVIATSFCGKRANLPTKEKAVDYLIQFVFKARQPINQTKLF